LCAQQAHEYLDKRAQDINKNGTVNLNDLVLLALAFGSKLGDPNWNPSADKSARYERRRQSQPSRSGYSRSKLLLKLESIKPPTALLTNQKAFMKTGQQV
jgi:hypothetical protein